MLKTESADAQVFLSIKHKEILRAFFEVIQPKSPKFQLDLKDHLIDFTQEYMSSFPYLLVIFFKLGLLFMNFFPVLYRLKWKMFCDLSLEEREKMFVMWTNSKFSVFRDFMKSLKLMVFLGFYEHPHIMNAMNYHPDQWVEFAKARRLKTHHDEVIS